MAEKLFEPEDFLDTIERMIELNTELLGMSSEEDEAEVILDLERLRDLSHRIKIQFGIEAVIIH